MARKGKQQSSQISIRDVARLAGVSLGSASRVLNGASNVTPDIRQRVEQAVDRLGYRPNHVARSLRSRTSKTVGMMFTDLANPLYARVFQAVESRLHAKGYMPLLANSLSIADREMELLGVFQSRAMDGVIITPGNERDPRVVAAVRDLPLPTVIYDRDFDVQRDCLLVEHAPALRELVARLIGLGHHRIALVLSQSESRPISRRIEGFRAGFEERRLAVPEDLVLRLPTVMSPAFDAIVAVLDAPRPPTAIVSLGTNMLGDVLNAIRGRGLRIPEDISVVSLGEPGFMRYHQPPISTLRIDTDIIADGLVSLLLDRIRDGDDTPPRRILLKAEYCERGSCAAAPVARRNRKRS